MDGLTNSSPDLEHFHDGKIAKGLSQCIEEIDRDLRSFDLPRTPLVHMAMGKDSLPKPPLVNTDEDPSYPNDSSHTQIPPSPPPPLSPPVTLANPSNLEHTPIYIYIYILYIATLTLSQVIFIIFFEILRKKCQETP